MGFRGGNASGRRIVLPPGAFWTHGASKMRLVGRIFLLCMYSVSESGRASFRQAHCFVQGPLRFFPVLPNPTCTRSHIWGLPKSGASRLLNTLAILSPPKSLLDYYWKGWAQ